MDKFGIHKEEKYALPSSVGSIGKSHAKSVGVQFCYREKIKNWEPPTDIYPVADPPPQVAGVGSGLWAHCGQQPC